MTKIKRLIQICVEIPDTEEAAAALCDDEFIELLARTASTYVGSRVALDGGGIQSLTIVNSNRFADIIEHIGEKLLTGSDTNQYRVARQVSGMEFGPEIGELLRSLENIAKCPTCSRWKPLNRFLLFDNPSSLCVECSGYGD